MTEQEIRDNKPTKKATHYAVDNDGKLIYLRHNKIMDGIIGHINGFMLKHGLNT